MRHLLKKSGERIGKARRMAACHVLVALVFAFSATAARADTHYVATNGSHIAPYTTWENAATNIQSAVDAAEDGDYIIIGDGTYYVPPERLYKFNSPPPVHS